jgi:DNA polymerase-3 subunit epsilon
MRFIAFDLETTGTLPGVDRIVEIGAVRFVNGEVEAVYSTLVDPKIPIPEAASRVNGITDDMLQGKPLISDLLGSFAEFCGDDYVIAHNAPFDTQFLKADIEKYESKAPTGSVLDTFVMAKKVLPGLANYKLGTLVQHLNIPSGQFHRAEEDASYCGLLFIKMMEKVTGHSNLMPPNENLVALNGGSLMRFPQIEPQPKQLDLLDGLL